MNEEKPEKEGERQPGKPTGNRDKAGGQKGQNLEEKEKTRGQGKGGVRKGKEDNEEVDEKGDEKVETR